MSSTVWELGEGVGVSFLVARCPPSHRGPSTWVSPGEHRRASCQGRGGLVDAEGAPPPL